jgi:hypothetical protein
MAGTKAVTSTNLTTSLRSERVERPVRQLGPAPRLQPLRRLRAYLARTAAEELAEIAQAPGPSGHREVDPRETYRELTANPVRWTRLT